MRRYAFAGSPYAIGRAYGAADRDAIHTLYRLRVQNAIAHAREFGGREVSERDVLAVARASLPLTEAYDPRGWRELEGIAEGAGLSLEQVLALNGLTDFRDVLAWPAALDTEGCTALVAQRDATADGTVLLGQTWDLATDQRPHVIAVQREPDDAPATWVMTTDGCLSLIGMNAAGIAVGTTNIRTTDARPGVPYLSVLHRMLAATTFEAALDAGLDAPRAGGHVYLLAHGDDVALVECSARWSDVTRVTSGFAVHANHCLVPENRAIEGATPTPSSIARQVRMHELATLGAAARTLDVASFERFLGDAAGGPLAISREDVEGVSTNGAVVMCPERGLLRICHGPPSRGAWFDFGPGDAPRSPAGR